MQITNLNNLVMIFTIQSKISHQNVHILIRKSWFRYMYIVWPLREHKTVLSYWNTYRSDLPAGELVQRHRFTIIFKWNLKFKSTLITEYQVQAPILQTRLHWREFYLRQHKLWENSVIEIWYKNLFFSRLN